MISLEEYMYSILNDNNCTFTEDEVMIIFNNIIRDVENKLNASVRDK